MKEMSEELIQGVVESAERELRELAKQEWAYCRHLTEPVEENKEFETWFEIWRKQKTEEARSREDPVIYVGTSIGSGKLEFMSMAELDFCNELCDPRNRK